MAFTLLIGLQFVITWLSVRFKVMSQLVKSEPTSLVFNGHCLPDYMRAERITHGEILTSLRERGIASLTEATVVVLENDGTLNALPKVSSASDSALAQVPGAFN